MLKKIIRYIKKISNISKKKKRIKEKSKKIYDGIILKNITKEYKTKFGNKTIYKNVNLRIPYGKNIGILGINGAGKSTLLRIIGGIDFPDKGEIISNKTFSWPLALSGGFQGSLSGEDNAKFICRIYGKKEEEMEKIISSIKEFSELNNDFYLPVKSYSTGMKAKLAFATSIMFDFDYFLLDETISVGDKHFKDKCSAAINDLNTKRNIILVSHDMAVLKKMCDIGLVISNETIKKYDIEQAIEIYNKL